jgi:hypothetical protein
MEETKYAFETLVSDLRVREAQKLVREAQEALRKAEETLRVAQMNADALHKSFYWIFRKNGPPHQRSPRGALPIREALRRRAISPRSTLPTIEPSEEGMTTQAEIEAARDAYNEAEHLGPYLSN